MEILFTKNKSVLSQLIRWVFDEPCSHVIFLFDDKWIVHSNLLGVNIRFYKAFMSSGDTEVVDRIKFKLDLIEEEELFQSLLESHSEESYDYKAFFYFSYRGLMYKIFNKPLPKNNPWGEPKAYLCTEIAKNLPEWITGIDKQTDLAITTPWTLRNIMKERAHALRVN